MSSVPQKTLVAESLCVASQPLELLSPEVFQRIFRGPPGMTPCVLLEMKLFTFQILSLTQVNDELVSL